MLIFIALCLGHRQNPDGTTDWMIVSESVGLQGFEDVRDIKPGEVGLYLA